MRFIPAVSGVQISSPPPIVNKAYRICGALFLFCEHDRDEGIKIFLPDLRFFRKKSVDIWGKDVYHNTSRWEIRQRKTTSKPWVASGWEMLLADLAKKFLKRNSKKFLTERNRCDIINKSLRWAARFERTRDCSLKTKQCRMNHATWFKPDV